MGRTNTNTALARYEEAEAEIALYHVVGPEWQSGDDLLSFEAQGGTEEEYAERWPKMPFGQDSDNICFVRSLDEAIEYRRDFAGCDSRILRVAMYGDEIRTNIEGYPFVRGRVHRSQIELVETAVGR